jgi:hypothetical protein
MTTIRWKLLTFCIKPVSTNVPMSRCIACKSERDKKDKAYCLCRSPHFYPTKEEISMKERFVTPESEVWNFNFENVVSTSNGDSGDIRLPDVEFGN